MTAARYLDLVRTRLEDDGAAVSSATIGGSQALVGYRSRFRLAWWATRLHLFTVASEVPSVTAEGLEQFTRDALAYAVSAKGRLRGLQTGVATIAVLVGTTVDPAAVAYAQDELPKRWGAFAWPTAVDLTAKVVHRHEGRVVVGGTYAGWLRSQTAVALPDPTTLP